MASTAQKVVQEPAIDNEIEPGERESLGIYITKLPIRSSGRLPLLSLTSWADPEGGGGGGGLKNHKNRGFLNNTAPDPLKITK